MSSDGPQFVRPGDPADAGPPPSVPTRSIASFPSRAGGDAPPPVPDHELLRCIGRGSYGEVWLARSVLGEHRAVKIVHRGSFEDDRPFEREFEGIRRFEPISRSHPSQLNILHVGRGEGCFYYVMELADDAARENGKTEKRENETDKPDASLLSSRLPVFPFSPATYSPKTLRSLLCPPAHFPAGSPTLRCRLPPAECVEIGLALATALGHLHAHGLVHRDIKPSNIIFVNGVPKLADIGLVTDVDASRSFVGTEGFLPPEGPGTPQADLYSLGKVLYEMSTGRDRKDYPALPQDWDALDAGEQARLLELNEALVKVCEADPRRRYQTAEELREDLALLQRGQSVRHQRTVERRFTLIKNAALVAAGLALLVTGGSLLSKRLAWDKDDKRAFSATPTASEPKSIAVLPFDNDSPNKADEYIGSQMAEELSSALTKLPELRVLGRSTAAALRSAKDPRSMARQLRLDAMLTGRVRKSGSQLRVAVELIDPSNDQLLWSKVYDQELQDVFGIETDIAQRAAGGLGIKLTESAKTQLAIRSTKNLAAEQLYWEGRFHWHKRTGSDLEHAIELFQRAIDLDPNYARAYSGLADCYAQMSYYTSMPTKEAFPKAKEAALKALAIDKTLAEPHTTLAYSRSRFDWDWAEAEAGFRRAIHLNPSYPTAHQLYSVHLLMLGRTQEAMAHARLAHELDPLSQILSHGLAGAFYSAREYERAIEQMQRTIAMDRDWPPAHAHLGSIYEQAGRFDEAVAEWETASKLSGEDPNAIAALRTAYGVSGQRGYWQKKVQQMLAQHGQDHPRPYLVALVYARLNDQNSAFEWLAKAVEQRDFNLGELTWDPVLDGLRSDPRFVALLRGMGLKK